MSIATPRQRVLAAVRRTGEPVGQPFSWGFGPTAEAKADFRAALAPRGIDFDKLQAATDDIVGVWPAYTGPHQVDQTPDYMAAWGIRTVRVDYGNGSYDEPAECPLRGLYDTADLAHAPWPDPTHFDFASIASQLREKDPRGERAVKIPYANPLEIFQWMTGLEESMEKLLTDPDFCRAAMDRIADVFIEKAKHTVAAVHATGREVDLMFTGDDLGSQAGLLISRKTYRELVMPVHARLFSELKRLVPTGAILYHTDGAVFDLLPDLLDAGIDILEAVQLEATGMDPARLKAAFGPRLSFHGAISVQQLLPRATPDQVRTQCRHLIDVLAAGGGYIAAPSHAIQIGTPVDNVLAMLETVLGQDRYQSALTAARA